MADYVQTWRKKLRLAVLVDVAKQELESGKDITKVYEILEEEMQERWRFVGTLKGNILMM